MSRWRAFRETAQFGSLDGLRFLSIVPVVWHHSTPAPPRGFLGRGPLGVDLFFAISGFLITTLLLRERDRDGAVSCRRFYARRALRIFPLYYAVLGVYVLRALVVSPPSPARAHFLESLPFYLTYTANWFVRYGVPHPVIFGFAWSLSTEEQFYAVFPWAVRVGRGWVVPAALAAGALVLDHCAENGLLLDLLPEGGTARHIARSIATPICLGALLAVALHEARGFAVLWRVLGHRLSAPVALGLVLAIVAHGGAPPLLLHAAMTLLVGACVVREDHGLRAPLTLPWLRDVGAVSYGIYMLHVSAVTATKALWTWAFGAAPHAAAVFALALPASYGAAKLTQRTPERPFQTLRERLRAPPPRGYAAPSAERTAEPPKDG